MLFNSLGFIFLFLPVSLAGFYAVARKTRTGAQLWLVVCSLFFYASWIPAYLPLVLASLFFNYLTGRAIRDAARFRRRTVLILGLAVNLGLLVYYKHLAFLLGNLNGFFGWSLPFPDVVLPLGISFFTFQQVGYLIDVYRGFNAPYTPLEYAVFIVFFPQWVAGPIIRHEEIIPQFSKPRTYNFRPGRFTIGLTYFIFGLFKKAILADGMGWYVAPVFAAARLGRPSGLVAWTGALAYTFQLYFDFSGYSDMAIGLGNMFNVPLPVNFNSPYKAVSLIDFWRRWHITLSRFLRDYLYIPLGGNRRGRIRRYGNVLATMILGGIWHGAGWTFIAWGALHGAGLTVNHLWREIFGQATRQWARFLGWMATLAFVVAGWTIFRATSMREAGSMLAAMWGRGGNDEPPIDLLAAWRWIAFLTILALLAPNTQQLMARYRPVFTGQENPNPASVGWRPSRPWAFAMAILAVLSLLGLGQKSEFLYFQF